VSVLVVTLLLPGFTLPTLVRLLGVGETAEVEERAEQRINRRAQRAALTTMAAAIDRPDSEGPLPEEVQAALRERIGRLDAVLSGESMSEDERARFRAIRERRHTLQAIEAEALAAARAEVLAARGERGVDPEAADRVLRRLDLRTVLLD
jgi:CPA1 family monovalent cation:H+ antiporter